MKLKKNQLIAIAVGMAATMWFATWVTDPQRHAAAPVADAPVATNVPVKSGAQVPYLPGLNASDVYLNLTAAPYNFEREDTAETGGLDRYTVKKTDGDTGAVLVVDTYTHQGTQAVKVAAKVRGSNLSAASWLLPYVATVPINGVDAQVAKAWVTANWSKAQQGRDVTKQLGGVVFKLTGDKSWRLLSVTGKSYDAWQSTID